MYYIGVDAGATKTHTILSDGKVIIIEDRTGPANPRSTGWDESIINITSGIKNVIQKSNTLGNEIKVCIGMAGVNSPQHESEALRRIEEITGKSSKIHVKVTNDTHIALESGSQQKNAIALICGTGANCYGRNLKGEEVHVGGLDYILSDEASGYMIGLQGLKAATKSMDGRIAKSKIESLLTKYLHISSMKDAEEQIYSKWKKKDIAACAYAVFLAGAQNDPAALQIISETVDEAILMLRTMIQKLDLIKADCVCVGGLFAEELFKTQFEQRAHKEFAGLNLIYPSHTPAWGAVMIAAQ
jgi:N-acetylglucosamine kinase-like BadF-type ATPase